MVDYTPKYSEKCDGLSCGIQCDWSGTGTRTISRTSTPVDISCYCLQQVNNKCRNYLVNRATLKFLFEIQVLQEHLLKIMLMNVNRE